MQNLPFITESGKDFVETPTVGGFSLNTRQNDFDSVYTEAANSLGSTDIRKDINTFIQSQEMIDTFKENLLSGFYSECVEDAADDAEAAEEIAE